MRFFLSLLLTFTVLTVSACAEKEKKKEKEFPSLPEIVMGSSTAPILIIDYSSLTCNHCAEFYLKVVPKIKDKYIKHGKVRLIFRDFPGDQVSLKAHQVAWCKGEMKYLDFVKLIYENQDKWLTSDDPIEALKKIVAKHGISAKEFDKALKNQEIMDKIIQARLEGQKKYTIKATPTLVINAKVYPEALSLEAVDEILTPILNPEAAKKKKDQKAKEAPKTDGKAGASKDSSSPEKSSDTQEKKSPEKEDHAPQEKTTDAQDTPKSSPPKTQDAA